jgi:hypothetical protein
MSMNGYRLPACKRPGDGVYKREECIDQVSICREKAQADPARRDYWIDEAVVWLQRSIEARGGVAVTYEVHDGRMIPKPAK